MLEQTFPSREALRRLPAGLADVAVFLGALALLYLLARVGAGTVVRFAPPRVVPGVSLDPANLPYYAARSTLRMFVALGFSLAFTLVYGYIAAHSRKAERVLIPLLDILQSGPRPGLPGRDRHRVRGALSG
jgi:NitT/TauT family transport system permease protein